MKDNKYIPVKILLKFVIGSYSLMTPDILKDSICQFVNIKETSEQLARIVSELFPFTNSLLLFLHVNLF